MLESGHFSIPVSAHLVLCALSTERLEKNNMSATRNSEPPVSIMVPCRNERDHIETALQSISAQEPPAGGFEVIVADSMSNDGTREILSRLADIDPRLRIVDNPGLIVSTGFNVSIREAKGLVILRLDAHTEYANDYVRNCLEVLRFYRPPGPIMSATLGSLKAGASLARR